MKNVIAVLLVEGLIFQVRLIKGINKSFYYTNMPPAERVCFGIMMYQN
nr:hypothetical protein [Mucilaginibacter sp. SP1R1]